MFYPQAVTEWSLSLGNYERAFGTSYDMSAAHVVNDYGDPQTGIVDQFGVQMTAIFSPPVGAATLSHVLVDLVDPDATTLADTSLPRGLPDPEEFGSATFTLSFLDGEQVGFVLGDLSSISTPAAPTSWGRLKSAYRN
jgi:hypothetical protein